MKNTKDNRAEVPAEPEVPTVEVSVKATVDHLEISDCAVARIQEVYDRFLSGCTDAVKENQDLLEDLKQETAVAVLEAVMSMSDDSGNPLSQADLYKVVEAYLTGWLNVQIATDEDYLSLQEIMQQMQANTEDDEYHDLDDCHGCDHCRRIVNIYNANGGVINIMI